MITILFLLFFSCNMLEKTYKQIWNFRIFEILAILQLNFRKNPSLFLFSLFFWGELLISCLYIAQFILTFSAMFFPSQLVVYFYFCVLQLQITFVEENENEKINIILFLDSTYLSESPLSNQANVKTDSDNTDHYDSVMQWLNQQACGGTVKRKRKINKQQVRSVFQHHEERSCSSKLNPCLHVILLKK